MIINNNFFITTNIKTYNINSMIITINKINNYYN